MSQPDVEYNDPPDTVILCQYERGPAAPSMSPFPVKLETYLRMADIPYQSVSDRGLSPKGKTPYIMYNGEVISDSQFCIEYLNKKYDVDLDKDLTPEEKAISRAFRKLTEDSLYWCLVLHRWNDPGMRAWNLKSQGITSDSVYDYYENLLVGQASSQGTGRHTKEEIHQITLADIQALADYLGGKSYLMGDKPTEVDCSVFGMLVQFKWQLPGSPYEKAIIEDYPKLDAYLLRIKETFWRDWDECHTHNNTTKPLH